MAMWKGMWQDSMHVLNLSTCLKILEITNLGFPSQTSGFGTNPKIFQTLGSLGIYIYIIILYIYIYTYVYAYKELSCTACMVKAWLRLHYAITSTPHSAQRRSSDAGTGHETASTWQGWATLWCWWEHGAEKWQIYEIFPKNLINVNHILEWNVLCILVDFRL